MKNLRIIGILVVLSLVLTQLSGCAIGVQAEDLTEGLERRTPETVALDDTFYTGQLGFSLSLFQQVAGKNVENLLLSPLSVSVALAMAVNGADGATAQEMLKVLGGYSAEELHGYLSTWMRNLPSDKNAKLQMADSIWYRDTHDLAVSQEFIQANIDYYDAALYQSPLDESAVEDINHWVDQHTDGMIQKLVDYIKPETMLMLINALAFEAKWSQPYEKSDVYEDDFHASDGTKGLAKFMRSTQSRYLEEDSAIGFLRPYKGGNYSFGALLPNEGVELKDYIQSLTTEGLRSTLKNVQNQTVEAHLPKFSNAYSVELNSMLEAMGMPTAFFPDADFSNMSNLDLHIGQVLHKTFIEVNEKGTKAAAVTGISMDKWSSEEPEEPKVIKLDRPFIYFILDETTDLPIFIGTVTSIKQ